MGSPNPLDERENSAGLPPSPCPADDELELYAMGRLAAGPEAALDEHLLVCQACQDRLAGTDLDVAAVKLAIGQLERRRGWSGRLQHTLQNFRHSRRTWLMLPAAAVLLLAVFSPMVRGPAPAMANLELLATRDAGTPTAVEAPEDASLNLTLNTAGLPNASSWLVQIADSNGAVVRQVTGTTVNSRVVVQVSPGLDTGVYWVRLASADSPEKLLREYALRIVPGT